MISFSFPENLNQSSGSALAVFDQRAKDLQDPENKAD
jgi:hypothetical protein